MTETAVVEEARLIILRELLAQPNRAATSTVMQRYLREAWIIDRSREWVERQFAFLAEMDTVRIVAAGTVKIAMLTPRGRDFLALKVFVDGILPPSEPL